MSTTDSTKKSKSSIFASIAEAAFDLIIEAGRVGDRLQRLEELRTTPVDLVRGNDGYMVKVGAVIYSPQDLADLLAGEPVTAAGIDLYENLMGLLIGPTFAVELAKGNFTLAETGPGAYAILVETEAHGRRLYTPEQVLSHLSFNL